MFYIQAKYPSVSLGDDIIKVIKEYSKQFVDSYKVDNLFSTGRANGEFFEELSIDGVEIFMYKQHSFKFENKLPITTTDSEIIILNRDECFTLEVNLKSTDDDNSSSYLDVRLTSVGKETDNLNEFINTLKNDKDKFIEVYHSFGDEKSIEKFEYLHNAPPRQFINYLEKLKDNYRSVIEPYHRADGSNLGVKIRNYFTFNNILVDFEEPTYMQRDMMLEYLNPFWYKFEATPIFFQYFLFAFDRYFNRKKRGYTNKYIFQFHDIDELDEEDDDE